MSVEKLRILIIEDNYGDFFLFQELLSSNGIAEDFIVNAVTLTEGINQLQNNPFDIVFLDLSLPDSFGESTFQTLSKAAPEIPVIVLTGMADAQLALRTVQLGAQDYLVKGDLDERVIQKSIIYSIERKKNLDKVKKSEGKYKHLFENNPIPMFAYDPKTFRHLVVNNAALEKYGYTEEEFLALTIFDIRPNEDEKMLREYLQTPFTGIRHSGEWRHKKKNGDIIYVDLIGHDAVINDTAARLVFAHDITDRKIAQKDVQFQANILENIKDIVIVTCDKGVINYWGKGATEALGFSKEEMVGKSLQLLLHKETPTTFQSILAQLQKYEVFTEQLPVKTKAGDTLWLDLKTTHTYNEIEDASGILWVSRDITESRQDKEMLLIQRSAIEAVAVGICITNPLEEGNPLVFSNPYLLQLTGYEKSEIIGNSFDLLFGPYTNSDTIAEINACLEANKPFVGEILNYKKNTDAFWNLLMITPIFNEEGKLINYAGFLQDITDQRMANENLIYKNRELNTFIYKASHDLRSPIASLMGLAELGKMEFTDKRVLHFFNMISDTSIRLDKILKTLLNLTALKEAEPEYYDINFREFLDELLESLPDHYNKEAVIVDCRDNAVVYSDKNILSEIVVKVLDNAYKYKSEEKEFQVEISLLQSARKNQIIIRDTGTGIEQASLPHVFDMFYRANYGSNGSGLGLYIVKNFVEKLKGQVDIQSEVDKGTTVTVELPATH